MMTEMVHGPVTTLDNHETIKNLSYMDGAS